MFEFDCPAWDRIVASLLYRCYIVIACRLVHWIVSWSLIQIDLSFGTRLLRGLDENKSFGSATAFLYAPYDKRTISCLWHFLHQSVSPCRTISCTPHRTILFLASYKHHSASVILLFLASLACPYSSSPWPPLLNQLLPELLFGDLFWCWSTQRGSKTDLFLRNTVVLLAYVTEGWTTRGRRSEEWTFCHC